MKTNKIITFLLAFIVMLVVCMTLFSPIPGNIKLIIRIILIVIFYTSWRWFHKKEFIDLRNLAFAFMVLNLAFLVVTPFTTQFWHLKGDTSKGFALSKLSDSLIISGVLILSFIIGGYKLKSICLTKGRLIPGLLIGMTFFIIFGYLAINNPQAKMEPGFIRNNFVWILVFVFARLFEPQLMLVLIAVTFITGILSGSYPALFLSSFQPVRILKVRSSQEDRARQFSGRHLL